MFIFLFFFSRQLISVLIKYLIWCVIETISKDSFISLLFAYSFFPLVDSNKSFQVRIFCPYPMYAVLYLVYIAWFSNILNLWKCAIRGCLRIFLWTSFWMSRKMKDYFLVGCTDLVTWSWTSLACGYCPDELWWKRTTSSYFTWRRKCKLMNDLF